MPTLGFASTVLEILNDKRRVEARVNWFNDAFLGERILPGVLGVG